MQKDSFCFLSHKDFFLISFSSCLENLCCNFLISSLILSILVLFLFSDALRVKVWLLLRWMLLGWPLLGWLLLTFDLDKLPLGETGCRSNPCFLLTSCLGIQIFDSPPSPTQSVRLPLVTYSSLCSTCVTYRTPCLAIGHQVLPTQPSHRTAEDFPRGGNQPKYVPLLTYLA